KTLISVGCKVNDWTYCVI
ncbi:hypothetical protein SNEBB_001516, partial [Seison nebaliae]